MIWLKVIGACGSAEKCALVKEHGALEAINYKSESLKDRVKQLTGGKGANIVFEAVGGKVMMESVRW